MMIDKTNIEKLKECDDALEISPDDTRFLFKKIRILHDLGRIEDALRICDKGLEFKPNDASFLSEKAQLFYISCNYKDALQYSKETVAIEPLDALAWVIIGSVLSKDSNQIEESLRAYGNASHICTEIDHNYDQVEMYDMALEVNPNDAGALYFKSRVYGSWGADGGREECYDRAIELFGEFGVGEDVVERLRMCDE